MIDFYFNGRCFFDLASMQMLLLQLALKIVAYYHFSLMQISSAPVSLQSFRCKYVCMLISCFQMKIHGFANIKWFPISDQTTMGPKYLWNPIWFFMPEQFHKIFLTHKARSLVCHKYKCLDLWRKLIAYLFLK